MVDLIVKLLPFNTFTMLSFLYNPYITIRYNCSHYSSPRTKSRLKFKNLNKKDFHPISKNKKGKKFE